MFTYSGRTLKSINQVDAHSIACHDHSQVIAEEWYQTSLSNWPKKSGGGFSQINDVSSLDVGIQNYFSFLTKLHKIYILK
jgi:hypothetical protein